MKRREMIKDKKEFTNIIKKGRFSKNKIYCIYIMKRNDDDLKLGIAISNKVGKAYLRNRLKRQTRAIIDTNRNIFKKGYNYIIMIRKGCENFTFEEMTNSLTTLLEK